MTDRDDFLDWVRTALYQAELALHNGDAGPRRAVWSRNEPVSILGAARNACGQDEVDETFAFLEQTFSDCTSYEVELQACDVAGHMAYTAGLEHAAVSMDGQPRSFSLRTSWSSGAPYLSRSRADPTLGQRLVHAGIGSLNRATG